MKLEIDTAKDSPEEIRAAIQMLQAHIRDKGLISRPSNQLYQQPIHPQYNYEDRLTRKIERAKLKQEERTYEETAVSMNIFDTPITASSQENNNDEKSNIRIIPY
jgi:hypothetical protein